MIFFAATTIALAAVTMGEVPRPYLERGSLSELRREQARFKHAVGPARVGPRPPPPMLVMDPQCPPGCLLGSDCPGHEEVKLPGICTQHYFGGYTQKVPRPNGKGLTGLYCPMCRSRYETNPEIFCQTHTDHSKYQYAYRRNCKQCEQEEEIPTSRMSLTTFTEAIKDAISDDSRLRCLKTRRLAGRRLGWKPSHDIPRRRY